MIYEKLYEIRKEMPAILKSAVVRGNIKYRKLEDILKEVLPLLEKFKVLLLPSEVKFFTVGKLTVRKATTGEITEYQHVSYVQKFTWVDIEDGTTLDTEIPTEGCDQTNQAKACKGANTTAQRTLFETTFLIPESDNEPHRDEVVVLPSQLKNVEIKQTYEDLLFKPDTPDKKQFFQELIFKVIEKEIDPKETELKDKTQLARELWKEVMQKKPLVTEVEGEIKACLGKLMSEGAKKSTE